MKTNYLKTAIGLFYEEIEITIDQNPTLSKIEVGSPISFSVIRRNEEWLCTAVYRTEDGNMWQIQRQYSDELLDVI